MCNHFATAPFALFIFDGGIIQHIYISVLSENLKTSKPQNLALLDNYISSVSYADTFSFRSKVNTLKPRSAREKEKAAF